MDRLNRREGNGCPSAQQLQAILQLGPEDSFSIQMRQHLSRCPSCQRQLDELTAAPNLVSLKQSLGPVSSADLTDKISLAKSGLRAVLNQDPINLPRFSNPGIHDPSGETPGVDVCIDDTVEAIQAKRGDEKARDLASDGSRFEIPTRIGRYEVLGLLGRGGMGTVYLGYDLSINRKVALKTLHHPGSDLQARLQREAEAIARIDSAHVVRMHMLEEDELGRPFLVMEYIEGETLAERLLRVGRMSAEEAAKICHAAALGVQAAHDQNVLHRDIKPGNILIDSKGRTRMADFGLAALGELVSRLTPDSITIGTPAYMSPEQAAGNRPTTRSDVYGLGCVLYEAITGRPLYEGAPAEILRQVIESSPPPLRSIDPSIPVDLDLICSKALSVDPELRYHSAMELAADLERWQNGKRISARPISRLSKAWRGVRRNRARYVGAALLTLTLIGALAFAYRSANEKQSMARQASEAKLEAQAHREALEQQRDLALKQLQDSVFETNGLLRHRSGTLELRKTLLESALESLQTVRGGESQPLLDRNTALAHLRLGQIQLALGDFETGQASLRIAQQIATNLQASSSEDAETCRDLASILASLGESELAARKLTEAERHLQQALQLREVAMQLDLDRERADVDEAAEQTTGEAAEQNSHLADAHIHLIMNLITLGDIRRSAGDDGAAESCFIQSAERATESLSRWPNDRGIRRVYAITSYRLAALALERNQTDLALKYSQQWKALAASLLSDDPRNTEYQFDNAQAFALIARVHTQQGKFDEATDDASQATQLYQMLAQAEPENASAQSRHATSLHIEGDAWYASGNLMEAHRCWMQAAEIHETLFNEYPSNTRYALLGGESSLMTGIVDLSSGRIETGLERVNHGYRVMKQGLPEKDENAALNRQMQVLRNLIDLFETAASLRDSDPDTLSQASSSAIAVLAYVLSKSGEIDKAIEIADSRIEFSDPDVDMTVIVHSMKAAVYAEAIAQGKANHDSAERTEKFRSLAFESLAAALAANPQWVHQMQKSPDFLSLRSEPQFQRLIDENSQAAASRYSDN